MSEIVMVKTSKIKVNEANPRIIKNEKYEKLLISLTTFPEMLNKRPLIVVTDPEDKKLKIIGGNMRFKAAQEIGLKELPVIIADDWSEEQRLEFLIKDNISAGEWDRSMLAQQWNTEELKEWDLEMPTMSSFQPNFNPGAANGEITPEDMLAAREKIENHFKQDVFKSESVICPHCATEFQIAK